MNGGVQAMETNDSCLSIKLPTILLVEDDFVTQMVHRHFLMKLGYRVEAVDNGRDALLRTEQKCYYCVILDLGLPGVSGECVLSTIRVRESGTGKYTHIIIVTACDTEEALSKYSVKNADFCFIKPISLHLLKTALQSIATNVRPETD